jgi:tRNA(His) 5'-end guanylyltransferase
MKSYEKCLDTRIVPHVPTILRIDGKAFHTYTKKCVRPYDIGLMMCFWKAVQGLYRELHFDLAYGQSDEVSLLFYKPDTFSQEEFEGRVFKLASIGASAMTAYFNKEAQYKDNLCNRLALFDCRVFQLPRNEVANYFIWRQLDATRNSIQMLGHTNFSPKELHGKNTNQIQDMVFKKTGFNWNDLPTIWRRGWCCDKTLKINEGIPIFTKNKYFIENYLTTKEESIR